LSLLIAILPYALALKAGKILGLLSFYFWKSRRSIAIRNIENIIKVNPSFFNEVKNSKNISYDIAREQFKNLGISLTEIVKIYYGLGKKIIDNVEIKGIHNYEKAKSKNKGVIFFTGHCGNWELMALAFGIKVDKIAVLARKQNNPYINKIIEKIRSAYGNRVIYKKGAIKNILVELKNNGAVGILADQAVLKTEGYKIDFLGIPAWTSKLPALIARKTGAVIIPAFINRNGKKHVINIFPEVQLSKEDNFETLLLKDTIALSKYIEDYIRKYPAEWLWIHRRWKRI
jgi:KDO2-lipid IV(A) lauroyltransferase